MTTTITPPEATTRASFNPRQLKYLAHNLEERRALRRRLYGDHEPVRTRYFALVYTYLTLLTDWPGMVKIGRSEDPDRRQLGLRYSDYGAASLVETWPTDIERALLDGFAGSLGVLRARQVLPRCSEAVMLDPGLMDAATGVVYSLSVDPTKVGLPWLTPQTAGLHLSWRATEHLIDTKRGGDFPIYIVDGTCVPLIPLRALEDIGVVVDDFVAEQRCRVQPWTPPGASVKISHRVPPAVPLWRALDAIIEAADHRSLDGERDEVASRVAWAAGQAALRAEREYHGTKAYIDMERAGH